VSSIDAWNCITCDPSNKLEYISEERGAKALQGYNTELNSLFISFRGSSNIQNWIDNVQVVKTYPYEDHDIAVELGFYKAYNYLKPSIFENLKILNSKYKTNNILITGHSLGGAEATLLAYDILKYSPEYNLSYFITFGSPRVGNINFVSDFTSLLVPHLSRITHYYDIVPHVPEEFLGFLHIPNEIWYNEENTIHTICNDLDNVEDKFCSNSCAPIHCTSTSDHLLYLNISMGSSGMC
jgi:predicted lipase